MEDNDLRNQIEIMQARIDNLESQLELYFTIFTRVERMECMLFPTTYNCCGEKDEV